MAGDAKPKTKTGTLTRGRAKRVMKVGEIATSVGSSCPARRPSSFDVGGSRRPKGRRDAAKDWKSQHSRSERPFHWR